MNFKHTSSKVSFYLRRVKFFSMGGVVCDSKTSGNLTVTVYCWYISYDMTRRKQFMSFNSVYLVMLSKLNQKSAKNTILLNVLVMRLGLRSSSCVHGCCARSSNVIMPFVETNLSSVYTQTLAYTIITSNLPAGYFWENITLRSCAFHSSTNSLL